MRIRKLLRSQRMCLREGIGKITTFQPVVPGRFLEEHA